ncbi:hypothetical protein Tco_0308244 [Tanacetum coccineum]
MTISIARYQRNTKTPLNQKDNTTITSSIPHRQNIKPHLMKHTGYSPTTMKHWYTYDNVLTNKNFNNRPYPSQFTPARTSSLTSLALLVGELAHIDTLPYIKTICHENGFPNLRIKYLSGFHILLQANMSIQTDAILSNQTITNCFKILKSWSSNFLLKNLLTWLSIEGLPPQAWHETVFTLIAKYWGEIVFPKKAKTIITTWLLEKYDDDGEDDFLDDESDGELFFNNDEFQNEGGWIKDDVIDPHENSISGSNSHR